MQAIRQGHGIQLVEENGDQIDVRFLVEGDKDWPMALAMLAAEDVPKVKPQKPLKQVQDKLRFATNQLIGEVRKAYVTDIPGQDMIYMRKEEETRRWLSATNPDIADYPFIAAEIGVTADTPDQLAQIWLNMAYQWATVAASLERFRLTTLASVAVSQTPSEAEALVQAMTIALDPFRP
jgi:hypothetical protein